MLSDTRPEIERIVLDGYRQMSPAQKLARVDDLRQLTMGLAERRIRSQYAGASDQEVRLRLGALTLGRDLMIRIFGWDPEREGW